MNLFRKITALFRKEKLDAEMAEEMWLHLERRTEENIASGLSPDEARFAAHRNFGGVEQVKEIAREQRGCASLEDLLRDFRFALRSLVKTPGFTTIAVLTLAFGLGLNTAMFSLTNVILLRPLPFENPEQLVRLRRATLQTQNGGFSPADYLDLKRAEAGFGQFAAFDNTSVSLSDPGRPAELQEAMRVSADFFNVLRIRTELGRAFLAEEEIFGRHRVAILSYAVWQDRFGAAPDIVGRTIRVDGEAHEVVGVLPASASDDRLIRQRGVFLPFSFTDRERTSRDLAWINVLGRRGDSVSVVQGAAFVTAFSARLAAEFPKENIGVAWRTEELLGSTSNGTARAISTMLLGLSAFVLLIACSNLANFLLARAVARSHELGVRASLGATRFQLLRPAIYEAFLLVAAGGAGALLVTMWATDWLNAQAVAQGSAPLRFSLDVRVLGFALGAALLTALAVGIAPALFTTRVDVNQALKNGRRGTTASLGHRRLRHTLIVGQFALAMVLLAGAGFFVRGADNLLKQHFGWDAAQVAQGGFDLPKAKYPGGEQTVAFQRQVIERLAQLPGAQAVSLSHGLPYTNLMGPQQYVVEGRERPAKGLAPSASFNGITPAYFEVTGSRLLSGRSFNTTDTSTSPKVVIVSESFARALFPNENPLGRRLARADAKLPDSAEIVGVATDVRTIGVYQRPISFQVYHPLAQDPRRYSAFAVRFAGVAPESMLAPIRAAFAELDPDLPVRNLLTAGAAIERKSFDLDMLKKLLGAFALLGLSLATLGLYGTIAHSVAQRSGEIGIRMALGAQMNDVIRLVLGSGLRLALIGAALGIVGAFGLSRLIANVMPAMQTNGGLVLVVATGLLVAIALLACWVPARRATKVDPTIALRAE